MPVNMKCSKVVPEPYFNSHHFVPDQNGKLSIWFRFVEDKKHAKSWDSEEIARKEIEKLAPGWLEQCKTSIYCGEMIFEEV